MKYIKLFELVKNEKNTVFIINKIINYIESKHRGLVINSKITPFLSTHKDSTKHYKSLITLNINEQEVKGTHVNKIFKYLDSQAIHLLKSGYLLGYVCVAPYSKLVLIVKDAKGSRANVPRFVYHSTSKENIDNIKKDGIILKHHNMGNYKDIIDLIYPPSIFVVTDYNPFHKYNNLMLKIDTSKINNKWWIDFNMDRLDCLMTYEPIPYEAIVSIKPY